MIRRPPRSTRVRSSAASDVYKRQEVDAVDLAPAVLLGAEQLEAVFLLLPGGQREQIGADAIARMAVVGQVFGEVPDQVAIHIQALVSVARTVVGDVLALVFVPAIQA